MPRTPRYQLRCARFCTDSQGAYRYGEVWVHIQGETLWVCNPCAEWMGRAVGIQTTADKRREVRERESKQQLRMEGMP